MTDAERIAFLERENDRQTRQLSLAGVTELPKADVPDAGELVQLHGMVVHKYPVLKCLQDEFERALLFCAFARRQEKLNASFFPMFWWDGAKDWLRRQGYPSNLSLAAFTAACVASGVPYSPLQNYPRDLEFGLQVGGTSRPSNAWRDVLANGIPRPIPLNRPLVRNAEPYAMISTDRAPGLRRDVEVRRRQ